MMEMLSIVVPCLNEQEAIPLFYSAFLKETAGMDVAFEFWFVDAAAPTARWRRSSACARRTRG